MITRSITRPIASPIARAVTGAYGGSRAFDPKSLFELGEQGVIYDPSDLSTLWQDSAGTTPVTAAGQPVGRMLDKSGRGNHVSFGEGANRPMLRFNATTGCYYLEPDGVDDFGVTLPIDFTATYKVTVITGIRKLVDTPAGMLLEQSANFGSTPGAFGIASPPGVGGVSYYAGVSQGAPNYRVASVSGYPGARSDVLVAQYDNSAPADADKIKISVSRSTPTRAFSGIGTGLTYTMGNGPLYLFRRAGTALPFNGHFYGLVIVGRLTTDAETRNVERLYANKTGVILA